jgi:putative DNA primase/helicase
MQKAESGFERLARKQQQNRQRPQCAVLPPPSAPMQVAREFVQQCCLFNGASNELTLRYWHGAWWIWRTSHWTELENREARSMLYIFTEHAMYFDEKGNLRAWAPNRYKVGDLLEALGAIVILSDEIEQPCWIDGRSNGAIVAVGNGLLDIASRRLQAHTSVLQPDRGPVRL